MYSNTPMLRQYKEIKDAHKDCILFFRLGDFYEMFGDDALLASKELEIVLTARDAGAGNKIAMCGVPYHSAEGYIASLVEKGYKVAICEQTEDPAQAKGIVKREVVRIITAGSLIEGKLLEEGENNFLLSLFKARKDVWGLAAVDISTGEFYTSEILSDKKIFDEIAKYKPAEIIVPQRDFEEIKEFLGNRYADLYLNPQSDYSYNSDFASRLILEQLNLQSLDSIGLSEYKSAISAAGAALDYLKYNQKSSLSNIFKINHYHPEDKMLLDWPTRKNLEIFESNNPNKKKASLLDIIDYTKTSMGGRKLKSWLSQPLTDLEAINKRLEYTKAFLDEIDHSEVVRDLLSNIYDLERIIARVSFESANARDLLALKNSLDLIPAIKDTLNKYEAKLVKEIASQIDSLDLLRKLLDRAIVEDPPFTIREGNLIKDNYNDDLDQLREISRHGKGWISSLEKSEREKTGIKNLKIGFNRVFGYYLEITKSNLDQAPEHYIRKQTLTNAERYITPELKEMEAKVTGADEKIKALEYDLFTAIREEVKVNYSQKIINLANQISQLDVYLSMSMAALKNDFTRPEMNNSSLLQIEALRHPVVEKNLEGESYIPNDAYMDQSDYNFLIITGPNMGGKSTYCRSIALAAVLAQTGSFVPAKYARLPVFDRIFARIGASDDLTTGQSTFMVEMNEVSNIVSNATADSLIILDEVGRGTSTYDGLSLAWALTEYISQKIKGKTLFATHYHELTELEKKHSAIKNLSVKVVEDGDKIVFLHEIGPGRADRSYGIQVAELAGLPRGIIRQAQKILLELEKSKNDYRQISLDQLMEESNFTDSFAEELSDEDREVLDELKKLDINQLTPLDALRILNDFKNKIS